MFILLYHFFMCTSNLNIVKLMYKFICIGDTRIQCLMYEFSLHLKKLNCSSKISAFYLIINNSMCHKNHVEAVRTS